MKSQLDARLRCALGSAGLRLRSRTTAAACSRRTRRIRPPAGLLGATIYEGEGTGACNCRFVKTYPYSFGPARGRVVSDQPEDRAPRRMGHYLRADRHWSGRRRLHAWRRRMEHVQLPVAGIRRCRVPCCAPGSSTAVTICSRVNNNAGIRPSPGQVDSPSAVDSSGFGQDAEAEPVERLGAAGDHARSRRRRGLCRQPWRRASRRTT